MESAGKKPRLVSVIIPCRNERRFVGNCLESVVHQDYPEGFLEIIVIDGMSSDGTKEIVEMCIARYPFIRIFSNERKITSCALNIGIKNATGEVIVRMDAHAAYGSDYISKCVKYLYESGADNVGGRMITLPQEDTLLGNMIVKALTSRFGVGNSDFRTGVEEPRETDTVFGGCYRKEVFGRIGLFNEKLASSQDIEFNLRLRKSGGKTMIFPDIVSTYYTRSNFISFCKNNFRNGLWIVLPFKYSGIVPVRLRHLVPLMFVTGLLGSFTLSIFLRIFLFLFILIASAYLLTNLYFSGKIYNSERKVRYFAVMPFVFVSLHLCYGLGSLWGVFRYLLPSKDS